MVFGVYVELFKTIYNNDIKPKNGMDYCHI